MRSVFSNAQLSSAEPIYLDRGHPPSGLPGAPHSSLLLIFAFLFFVRMGPALVETAKAKDGSIAKQG